MVRRRQAHSEVRQQQLDRPSAEGTGGMGSGRLERRRGRESTAHVLASRSPATALITKSPPARWAWLQEAGLHLWLRGENMNNATTRTEGIFTVLDDRCFAYALKLTRKARSPHSPPLSILQTGKLGDEMTYTDGQAEDLPSHPSLPCRGSAGSRRRRPLLPPAQTQNTNNSQPRRAPGSHGPGTPPTRFHCHPRP